MAAAVVVEIAMHPFGCLRLLFFYLGEMQTYFYQNMNSCHACINEIRFRFVFKNLIEFREKISGRHEMKYNVRVENIILRAFANGSNFINIIIIWCVSRKAIFC